MSNVGTPREWYMFLGARNRDEAISEIRRLVKRLDDAYDITSYVVKLLSGCPASDAEDVLRIARKSLDETIELLNHVNEGLSSSSDVA